MRDEIVARNYAETLFELARAHEGLDVYGEGIETVARLVEENPDVRLFLETPRIDAQAKKEVVRRAFGDVLPEHLVRFLLVVIDKRRQRLIGRIAREFGELVDAEMGRQHVDVTVARGVDDETREALARALSKLLGKTAIPHLRVDPAILGGVVVRTGDTIWDGSLERRVRRLRTRLLAAELPEATVELGRG